MTPIPFQSEIVQVSHALKEINLHHVFVGGAVAPLLLTDQGASHIRPTDDIDAVVGVASRHSYHNIEEELRSQGFQHDIEGPMCRWVFDGFPVDIMPTDKDVLGFSNQWYSEALRSSIDYEITSAESVSVPTAPVFIATKIEAFKQRGNEDYYASHDLEDIITIIDGRPELVDEIRQAAPDVQTFLRNTFKSWLGISDFTYALPGHLPYPGVSNERAQIVERRISQMCEA